MEVAIGTNGNTPFQREVREWQRIDPNTGALLSGRLEADRWINGPLNTYGKVVDSQNISQPNGTQQSQRKQLELYQARTSSGSMQVIRAQTVQTTSSRWSTSPSNTKISNSFDNNNQNQRNSVNLKNAISTNVNSNSTGGNQITKTLTNGHNNNDDNNMKNIIVNNNHYQNSQNHKMLTAPSLKLSNLMKSSNNNCNGGGNNSLSVSEKNNLHCINSSMPLIQNHHHQHKKTEMQRKYDNNNEITTKPIPIKSLMLQHDNNCNRYEQHLLIHQQQQHQKQLPPTTLDLNRVGGVVVDFDYDDVKEHKNSMINKFTKEEKETDFYLQRGRSVSTDDLTTDWNENNNNADDAKNESSEWRRVSKIRRSFQLPKSSPSPPIKLNSTRPIDLPENSVSVSKIRHELENGRRLNTAMRNNNVDLAALDTILNGNSSTDIELSPTSLRKTAFLTSESLKEIRGKLKKLSDESLYKDDFLTNGGIVNMELNDNNHNNQTNNEDADKTSDIHTKTNHNSFENRSRYRDTSSAEWHLRRKSYGFEKMTPPDNKTMYRQETSTDSGIGRSSELGNWSPTESRGTIIAFGEQPKNSTTVVLNGINGDSGVNLPSKNLPIVQRRFRQNSEESSDTSEMKRHSIAVDETKYVRDNLRKVFDTKTSIHLNGLYSNDKNLVADEIGRQRKRVEFCKTEVHFAAESGRVNIVETDGKPPPTNNFRRRRRSSGNTYLDAITSGLQIMHFGDEKKATILEQESESLDDLTTLQNNVTVSVPIVNEMAKKDGITKNMLDEIEQDEISLRGILKNKPIKPKPYHLGENIDTKEKFWGVKLKPVTTAEENDQLFENGTSNICDLDKPDIAKTDFDRVKFVEERKNGTGYSTKINLSLTDTPFEWNSNSESIKSLKLSATNNIEKNIDILRNSSNHLINDNTKINEQCLKSTSLIMQQIRSNLNQFDDEEIHINATAIQKPIKSSSAIISNTTKLISNMSAITKSNSANSIFLEKQRRQIYTKPNYSSSLDGDIIINEPTFYTSNILKSNQNFTQNNSSYNMTQSRFMSVLSEEPQKEHEIKPIPAPRIKIIGSNRAPQIRRINDNSVGYGGFDSDDSAKADEEVKSYLSSGNRRDLNIENNESKISTTAEMFGGSWSRIKAQRFVQKSKIILPEVPQSNIMSIELRSPDSSAKKLPTLNSQETKSSPQIPIAKPRTTVKSSLSPENTNLSNQKTLEINNSYQPQRYQTKTITNEFLPVVKEPLKIVTATNGARKLREHELSYFGVKVNTDDNHNMQRITNTELKNLKPRSINNHKNIEIIPNIVTSKWKLSNDKPDLLRHGPVDNITLPSVVINLNDQSPDRNVTEHIPIYENLQTSSKYNRNKDLDRDEKNLSEMAETADITLKAVTDRHKIQAQKYHQRIEMHSSTPLGTIDEKRSTRTFYDLESEEKLKPTSVLPVVASDSFQRKCCSRRSSSASSTGSISDSASINRSHSRSRSREKIDNNNIKKSSLSAVVVRPRTEHRSSSRDSQKSHNNSVENFKLSSPPQKVERKIKRTIITSHSTHHNDKPEPMPRHRREETKTIKSSSNRKESSSNQHGEKSSIDKSTSSGRKESKNRLGEKSSSSDRKESIQRHGERLATDRKESSSRHHRERSSNDIGDSSDRLKHSSRSSTSRVTTSDSHKQCTRSSKDFKDPSNIRSSQRSANNRTENSDSHQMKTRTDSHERHPSQERHKNSSSTRSSSGKPKLASSMDQKQRTAVRSSGGNTTNPTIVNSMTKTSSSRHHRSRKDHPRK